MIKTRNESTSLRLAYLTTEYPKASHTFIRREIHELERRGHTILRVAIRASRDAIVDSQDHAENKRTFHCLAQSPLHLLASIVILSFKRPRAVARAVRIALGMWKKSDRGLMRHCAYLVEAATILRLLDRHNVQHVHVHFGTNAATVARLMKAMGGPAYSMTVHGPAEFDSPRTLDLQGKMCDATFAVAISEFGASQLCRWVPYEYWKKIHVVRCTVDQSFFDTTANDPAESKTFVSIGRLVPQKGQHLLIDAMATLQRRGVDANLVIIGDGEMRSTLQQRIDALGLADRVHLTGWADESTIRSHLANARALVMPSFAEGLPVVIMEAMAMGRPIIASRIAGIPELVVDGEHGWLITPGNVGDLVGAMQSALIDDEAIHAMNGAAKARVKAMHTTRTQVDVLESLFRSAITRRLPQSSHDHQTEREHKAPHHQPIRA